MKEKKFNNAIQKAERLSDRSVKKEKREKADGSAQKNAASAVSEQGQAHGLGNWGSNDEYLAARDTAEINAEQKRADDRVHAAEIRQKRKNISHAKKKAKQNEKQGLKALKIQKKEERLALKQKLKHERKQAKIRRKKEEKEAIVLAEREKRIQKAQMRKQKLEAKRERRLQRAESKRQRRQSASSRGIGGWLAAVISLGTACLILSTLLVWGRFMMGNGESMLSGVYSKSFYDLVSYVDNMDVNLEKLALSNDNRLRQRLASEVMVQANLAEEDLMTLPMQDSSKASTAKFINQLADFAKYINNKLIEGLPITEEDEKTLESFRSVNAILKEELDALCEDMGCDFKFITLLSGEEKNLMLQKFTEIESNSVEYPKMIYDGPFSDEAAEDSEQKPLKRENAADEGKIKERFNMIFSDYGVTDVQITGMAEGKTILAYNVEATCGEETLFAQISDGMQLVTFDWYRECKNKNYDRDYCITVAQAFLQKCGYKLIKPVWVNEDENTLYVNFAAFDEDGGVILYSDLIKVSVCMDGGVVYDMDAKGYIENHKARDIAHPALTVEEAERKIGGKIEVETSRLVLIPLDNGTERLAYEFCGAKDGNVYYVYIDALTGEELQIFKVVSGRGGTLLL